MTDLDIKTPEVTDAGVLLQHLGMYARQLEPRRQVDAVPFARVFAARPVLAARVRRSLTRMTAVRVRRGNVFRFWLALRLVFSCGVDVGSGGGRHCRSCYVSRS